MQGKNQVLYRLPNAKEVHRITSSLPFISSVQQGASGFLLIPSVIRPIKIEEDYSKAFDTFHGAVQRGDFSKLVLARTKHVYTEDAKDPETLFHKACRMYPQQMVCLVQTQEYGDWLMASPEVLLSYNHKTQEGYTMALAGTMVYKSGGVQWSDKNKQEQQIVAQFIQEQLQPLTSQLKQQGPIDRRAGELVHLCTEFLFHTTDLSKVVESLHPTPAICGFPKEDAIRFIENNEHVDRRLFSGLVGTLNMDGSTQLYVILRCMQILSSTHFLLYAGGGIMADSEYSCEWDETERKMKTMENVLS